jgi:hypothetical protein
MATEKQSLHQEALDLLQRINADLKNNKLLETLNVKMVGVVKDLNDVQIAVITGKEMNENSEQK